MIEDNEATKPDDWEDDKEGEWGPPLIRNPDYIGPWVAPKIYNPKYRGEWKPRIIPNPRYKHVVMENYTIGGLGFDVSQVTDGTIFDNILITDSLEEALKQAKLIFDKQIIGEYKAKTIYEKELEEIFTTAKRRKVKQRRKKEEREDL